MMREATADGPRMPRVTGREATADGPQTVCGIGQDASADGNRDGPANDSPGRWLSIPDAARALGVSPRAIRGRIKRRTLESRPRGNTGLEVYLPAKIEAEAQAEPADEVDGELARLRDELAGAIEAEAEARVAVARAEGEVGALRQALDWERQRGDRLDRELGELRRPWFARWIAELRRTRG